MEKRREPRRDYFSRVEIEGTSAEGDSFRMHGMIEDRSASGFGIRVRDPIPAGSEIRIRHAGRLFNGTVRHCARDRDSFFLGVLCNTDPATNSSAG